MSRIQKVKTVSQFNELYGLPQYHPLVAVIDYSKSGLQDVTRINSDLYSIFIRTGEVERLYYGDGLYSYELGDVSAFAPGQIFGIKSKKPTKIQCIGVVFSPDLILGSPLGRDIISYRFFSYECRTGLKTNQSQRNCILNTLQKIEELIKQPNNDNKGIISAIQKILNICMEIYSTQKMDKNIYHDLLLTQLEREVVNYIYSDLPEKQGLPSVQMFADKFGLTANYFGDLIKRITGISPKTYIQQRIIFAAKEKLTCSTHSIAKVSEELGFRYATHFTRLFSNEVGMSPSKFRRISRLSENADILSIHLKLESEKF